MLPVLPFLSRYFLRMPSFLESSLQQLLTQIMWSFPFFPPEYVFLQSLMTQKRTRRLFRTFWRQGTYKLIWTHNIAKQNWGKGRVPSYFQASPPYGCLRVGGSHETSSYVGIVEVRNYWYCTYTYRLLRVQWHNGGCVVELTLIFL